MGWASLSVAMVYIHASGDRVLKAFESASGQDFGHALESGVSVDSSESLQPIDESGVSGSTHR